uniref:PWI domain-containing protein n=1 Tax=Sinocyclocheilus rhinocerous TaxID=307959 RepID=A0A673LQ08_9TELE
MTFSKSAKERNDFIFASCLSCVDMTKVNLEVVKPWITQRVTEILGFEDDVVIEFVFNQLDEKVDACFALFRCLFTHAAVLYLMCSVLWEDERRFADQC